MALEWPHDLPQHVDRQGYRYQPGDGRLKSTTDTGGGKVRRRDSNPPSIVTAPITLSAIQKSRLERFWEQDTSGGVKPFWFPAVAEHGNNLTDDLDVQITTEVGEPIQASYRWFCRFDPDQPPPAFEVYTGVTWRAVIQLWRLS